jgi:hypothetical protein
MELIPNPFPQKAADGRTRRAATCEVGDRLLAFIDELLVASKAPVPEEALSAH